jgi:hypothetical protein
MSDGFPGLVCQAQSGIWGRVMVTGTELTVPNQRSVVNLPTKPSCNNFLQKFPAAFQERDQTIHFGDSVVHFARFGDDDDGGVPPGVFPKGEGMVKNEAKGCGACLKGPSDEKVPDA